MPTLANIIRRKVKERRLGIKRTIIQKKPEKTEEEKEKIQTTTTSTQTYQLGKQKTPYGKDHILIEAWKTASGEVWGHVIHKNQTSQEGMTIILESPRQEEIGMVRSRKIHTRDEPRYVAYKGTYYKVPQGKDHRKWLPDQYHKDMQKLDQEMQEAKQRIITKAQTGEDITQEVNTINQISTIRPLTEQEEEYTKILEEWGKLRNMLGGTEVDVYYWQNLQKQIKESISENPLEPISKAYKKTVDNA